MKIAVSTDQGQVSAHFGRCPSYTIFEIENGEIKSQDEIPNPGHQPGFLPRFLAEKGVDVILCGGMGPRAQALFAQNKIETISGIQGAVGDVVHQYLKGALEAGEDMCGHHHGDSSLEHDHQAVKQFSLEGRFCISAMDNSPEAEVDPRFGRAAYFVFIDPKTWKTEVIENPHRDLDQGAGIQAAQFIVEKKAATLLTGECGPKALEVFGPAGVAVVSGVSGKVEEVIKRIKAEVQ